MSEDDRPGRKQPTRYSRIWKGVFVLGVLAFGAIVVRDMHELWRGRDAAAAHRSFGKCAICHSLEPLRHGIGPSLNCVAGRRIGSLTGYRYSIAMLHEGRGESESYWSVEKLAGYIVDPHGVVPGTRMPFPGLKGDPLPLIRYIQSQCEYDALAGKHELLLIRTDARKAFKGCDVERMTATRSECEEVLRDLTIGDLTQPANRPLRVCVPAGQLSC
jgi:cytochrome c2